MKMEIQAKFKFNFASLSKDAFEKLNKILIRFN